MKVKFIRHFIIILALIPATFLLFMSMYGLNLLLTSGYENSLSLIFSIVIGILGYVG